MRQDGASITITLARIGAGLCALALAACAQTASPGALDVQAGLAAPSATGLAAASAPAAGFALSGASFAGDLRFSDATGAARAVYVHAVDNAPTLTAELRPERNWLSDGVQRFEGVSDRGVPVTVELEAGPCQTGGRTYGRFATVYAGRLSYDGCAGETGPHISWADGLADHLPAIRQCLEASQRSSMAFVRGAGRAQVLHARTGPDGAVVRMRFGESGRWDCTLSARGADWRVASDAAPARPGEGDPVFFPGALPPSGEACYVFERVRNAAGETLGALGYDACASGPLASLAPGDAR